MDDRRTPKISIGASSLIALFCIICLSVFSVLALLSAKSEKELSEKSSRAAVDYYMADTSCAKVAQTIFDLYRSGAQGGDIENYVHSVFGEFSKEGDDIFVSYSWKIDKSRDIYVELLLSGENTRIKTWKTLYAGEWETDQFINLWDGELDIEGEE